MTWNFSWLPDIDYLAVCSQKESLSQVCQFTVTCLIFNLHWGETWGIRWVCPSLHPHCTALFYLFFPQLEVLESRVSAVTKSLSYPSLALSFSMGTLSEEQQWYCCLCFCSFVCFMKMCTMTFQKFSIVFLALVFLCPLCNPHHTYLSSFSHVLSCTCLLCPHRMSLCCILAIVLHKWKPFKGLTCW